MILYLLIIAYLSNEATSQVLTSPCPNTFYYENQTESDKWFGDISIQTLEELSGVWITIKLDNRAELMGNWFGESFSSDNKEFRITNPDYILQAGPPVTVRFFVQYNPASGPIPRLETIRLNGKTICSENNNESKNIPKLHISKPRPATATSSSGVVNNENTTNNGKVHISSGSSNDRNLYTGTSRPPVNTNNNYNAVTRPSSTATVGNNNRNDVNRGSHTQEFGGNKQNLDRDTNNRHETNRDTNSRPETNRDTNSRPETNRDTNSRPETNRDTNSGPDRTNGDTNNRSETNRDRNRYTNNQQNRDTDISKTNQLSTNDYNRDNSITGSESNRLSSELSSNTDDFFEGDFNVPNDSSTKRDNIKKQDNALGVNCGTVALRPRPLISFAQDTTPGEWPWHVALYRTKGIQLTYICGGTVISESHILTAAHCVTKSRSKTHVDPKVLVVYLGKYNLKTFGPETQDRDIEDIFVHPEFNATTFYNDIAILKLSRPIEITDYVRPICLWEGDTNLEYITNKEGTVIGWGFDEKRVLSEKLMQAKMPIVSTIQCIYSNRDFFSRFTFDKNFCAGFRNGTSVCNGDSGGSMVFPKTGTSGQNTVWQIRGLVSVGVALQTEGICDTSQYVIFTDVAKHLSWIRKIVNSDSN